MCLLWYASYFLKNSSFGASCLVEKECYFVHLYKFYWGFQIKESEEKHKYLLLTECVV